MTHARSMKPPALHITNLSKRYHLGECALGDHTLRDAFASMFSRWRGRSSEVAEEPAGSFWALRNISFDVALVRSVVCQSAQAGLRHADDTLV
jgi:hypothetical protein